MTQKPTIIREEIGLICYNDSTFSSTGCHHEKSLKLCLGALSGVLTISLAGFVHAQATTSKTELITPPPPPPKLEVLEEGAPAADMKAGKPEQKNQVKDIRNNAGKVTEVQVQSGGSHYVLKADPEIGNAPKGTAQGDNNRAPQWTILQFGGKKKVKKLNLYRFATSTDTRSIGKFFR